MQMRQSAEDYLEAILMLKNRKGYARSIDIARELGVSKPSVSVAMRNLSESGYVEMDDDYLITLTEAGLKVAERVYERHVLLTNALAALGVDRETAEADACKIEHDISAETFAAIKSYYHEKCGNT